MPARHCFAVALSVLICACDVAPTDEPAAAAASEPGVAAEPAAAAPAPPAAAPATPALAQAGARAELGKPAPDFTLTGVDGTKHTLSALKGKVVVLEWFNPDCPFVKHARGQGPLPGLAKQHAGDSLVWLSINSSGEGKQGHGLERNKTAVTEYGITNPVLLDPSGEVGHAFGAERTPHMFVIDAEGVLVYRGGLDNAPMGTVDAARPRFTTSTEGSLVDYVTGAIEDVRAKQALRLADTPPYGCSVKYGDA